MKTAIIRFEALEDFSTPWPIGLNADNRVTSGLGPDDGSKLFGFGPKGEQHVTVWAKDALANPESVVGLVPTFVGRGQMFEWSCKVASLTVRETGL